MSPVFRGMARPLAALLGQLARGVVPCPYAPRTGGAYDSHHRTAGIAGCTRRRGRCLAARGARQQRIRRVGVLLGLTADDLESSRRVTALTQTFIRVTAQLIEAETSN